MAKVKKTTYPTFTREMMQCLIDNDMGYLYEAGDNAYVYFTEDKDLHDLITEAPVGHGLSYHLASRCLGNLPGTMGGLRTVDVIEDTWSYEIVPVMRYYKKRGKRSQRIPFVEAVLRFYDGKGVYQKDLINEKNRGWENRKNEFFLLNPTQIEILHRAGFAEVPSIM